MFLFWNRLSWVTCYDRYGFFVSGALTFVGLSPNRKPSSWSRISNIILTFCRCCLIIPLYIYLLLGILVYFSAMKTYTQKISANIKKRVNDPFQEKNSSDNGGNNKKGNDNILMRIFKSKAFHKGLFIAISILIIKYIIFNIFIIPEIIDTSKIIFFISIISAFINSLFEELFGYMYINGKLDSSINTNTLFSEGPSEYTKAEEKMKEDSIGNEADLTKEKRKREIDRDDDELLERVLKQSKKEQNIVDSSLDGQGFTNQESSSSKAQAEISTVGQSITSQETSKITETFTSTETSAMANTGLSSQAGDSRALPEETPEPFDPLMDNVWEFRHSQAIARQREIIAAEEKFQAFDEKWPDHHNIHGASNREFEDDTDIIKEQYREALNLYDEQARYINQLEKANKHVPADVRDPRIQNFYTPDIPEDYTDRESNVESSADDSGVGEED